MSVETRADRLRVVMTTVGSEEEAKSLSRTLVERKLAACVSTIPGVRSVYWWEGKITEAEELTLLVKTTREMAPALMSAILELHSYETPEVIILDPVAASDAYSSWVVESLL